MAIRIGVRQWLDAQVADDFAPRPKIDFEWLAPTMTCRCLNVHVALAGHFLLDSLPHSLTSLAIHECIPDQMKIA